jgi:GNAT superfamily N-acetyltransferase
MQLSAQDIRDDHVEVLETSVGMIGFLRLQRRADVAWLEDLFVDPSVVRQGHGRRLFEHAADVSRGWGYAAMGFESDPFAEGFYARLGAKRVGSPPSELMPGRELPLMRLAL